MQDSVIVKEDVDLYNIGFFSLVYLIGRQLLMEIKYLSII